MKQNPALWLSMALSVFILFTASSVIKTMISPASAEGNNAATSSAVISPEQQQAIAEREAAYVQMIQQANQQLAAAQAALSSAGTGVTSTQQVSAASAAQIAEAAALNGAARTGDPELVDFEGTVAYEVPFDLGNIYVDAATSKVIYNGTNNVAPSVIGPEQAGMIAANYMGRSDVYRVELVVFGTQTDYQVTFVNGDVVFVDQYGQIALVQLASTGGEGEHEDND